MPNTHELASSTIDQRAAILEKTVRTHSVRRSEKHDGLETAAEGKANDSAEVTETEDDLQTIDPSLLGQAVVFGTDWTAATLIDQLRRGNIKLDPIFQRRDAWNVQRKSRFVESVVLGLPIPQIVLAEAKDDHGSFLIIDGKQRLLSLQQFAGITATPDNPALALTDLKFRPELNNKTYEDLKNDTRLRNHLNAFDNQPIRTVVVKNWQKEEILYLIFHRLNSETLPLSPQELRQALHPGPFLRYAADYTLTTSGIHRALGIDCPDFRMRDVELFVRYFAFQRYINDYAGNLKSFLDDTCRLLNQSWPREESSMSDRTMAMEAAISASFDIFGEHTFRKYNGKEYENRFNRAVFDIMLYYFTSEGVRNRALTRKPKVREAFQALSANRAFVKAIETTTKSVEATRMRFEKWGQQLAKTLSMKITVPAVGKE